jgi:hypothetical protein
MVPFDFWEMEDRWRIAMIKLFWNRFRRSAAARDLFAGARCVADPLDHPAIRAMSERELADIPFPRAPRSARQR